MHSDYVFSYIQIPLGTKWRWENDSLSVKT